jgi:large subunit ribosomal protein L4
VGWSAFLLSEINVIEIPVINIKGEKVGSEKLDPALFGLRVRHDLLKQAVIAYRNGLRQGTVQTKSRAMVHGASKKLYKQKGTGRARAGNLRTPTRRGGGHAFAKINRDFSMKLNKSMRRLARNNAVLAKATSGSAMILQGLSMDAPKTSKLAGILKATGVQGSALISLTTPDINVIKSGRNIPALSLKLVREINAYDVLKARKVVFTPEAFKELTKIAQAVEATA